MKGKDEKRKRKWGREAGSFWLSSHDFWCRKKSSGLYKEGRHSLSKILEEIF